MQIIQDNAPEKALTLYQPPPPAASSLRRRLHLQADRIEQVLSMHEAPGRVTGGRVTSRTIQFHLQLAPTTRITKVEGLAAEIALALDVPDARESPAIMARSISKLRARMPAPRAGWIWTPN